VIYTVGHSNHNIEKFIGLLKANGIESIIELRSVPKSKYSPHFNKPNLTYELSRNGIRYLDMGKYLGGRPDDKTVLNIENKIEEDLIEKKEWYLNSIMRLINLSKESKVAIMCSEENPNNCHRGYIITHTLLKKGEEVSHIRGSGKIQFAQRIPKQMGLAL
jgi:uncharacterized protein (DUF488 family)|tara:strand:- start:619 stop:1101 length:483 start_codon:yes stop_codon:yes gene_type:complete